MRQGGKEGGRSGECCESGQSASRHHGGGPTSRSARYSTPTQIYVNIAPPMSGGLADRSNVGPNDSFTMLPASSVLWRKQPVIVAVKRCCDVYAVK